MAKFYLFRFKDSEINTLYTKHKGKREWHTGIFPNTFLQLVNDSKNSILNWVIKLNLFMCFCSFFVFETPLKDFPFYSSILLTLWSKYYRKESYMYLSSQLFFKTPNRTLKITRKIQENAFFSDLKTYI